MDWQDINELKRFVCAFPPDTSGVFNVYLGCEYGQSEAGGSEWINFLSIPYQAEGERERCAIEYYSQFSKMEPEA